MSIGLLETARRHRVLAAIDAVTAAMSGIAEVAVWPLADSELLTTIDDCEREMARLAELQLRCIREMDGRNVAAAQGATSTAALLRARLRISPGDAHARVDLAAAIDGDCARVGQALADGIISVDHAETILRAIRKLPKDTPAEQVRQAEELLVNHAIDDFDPAEIGRLGVHIRNTLTRRDPDGGNDDEGNRPQELWLTETGDGRGRLRADLDAATFAALRSALDPLSAPTPAADGVSDMRSAATRRADALGDLVGRALDAGSLPTSGGVRPHVTVTVTLAELLGAEGAPAAETDWGVPLSAATLARICCDAGLTRVLLDPAGVPLDVGREERIVPAGLRRALIARDRGCAFPGCDRPPAWCEAHHLVEWHRGGATKLDNLVLLCRRHHGEVHHRGWEVRLGPDRLPEFLPPVWVDRLRRPRRNPHCRAGAGLFRPRR
jgi:Domain of unknown function (DUF222)/HNH endonuclease